MSDRCSVNQQNGIIRVNIHTMVACVKIVPVFYRVQQEQSI